MSLQPACAFNDSTMKTKLSSLSICGLILILLPVTFSTSPAANSWDSSKGSLKCPTDKSIPFYERKMCEFVEKQKNITDPQNPPTKRTVQLYSRASKLHVQIMKTELDARGRDGSGYARLVLESDNFGRIKIRGENTNRYLCINKKGDLVARVKKQRFALMRRCIFNEEITSEGYYQYKSVRYPDLYIGFSKGGRPRNGKTSAKRQIYRHFTPRVLGRRKHRREAKIRKIIKLLKQTLHRRRA
ncbi:hypothetical protein ACROYT_G006058 [Oculina patagonica]